MDACLNSREHIFLLQDPGQDICASFHHEIVGSRVILPLLGCKAHTLHAGVYMSLSCSPVCMLCSKSFGHCLAQVIRELGFTIPQKTVHELIVEAKGFRASECRWHFGLQCWAPQQPDVQPLPCLFSACSVRIDIAGLRPTWAFISKEHLGSMACSGIQRKQAS